MSVTRRTRRKQKGSVFWASITGGFVAAATSVLLTIVLSLQLCLGLHPEAALAAEWSAPLAALLWTGALMRKSGRWASLNSGAVLGFLWFAGWLYMMARFSPKLWMLEAVPSITWHHVIAWTSAPVLSFIGGEIGFHLNKLGKIGRFLPHIAAPLIVLIAGQISVYGIRDAGEYALEDGISLSVIGPDRDGNTVRLFTFDFAENPDLHLGVYDCDSHDSDPFNNRNTSYLGTPALSVMEELGPETLFVVNAGFYNWKSPGLTASHIAPMVLNGRPRYNVRKEPLPWTFGWKMVDGTPRFKLERKLPFKELGEVFDTAMSEVRPLVVDGREVALWLGPGLTFLNCSRVSVGWNNGSSKLHVLVVRGRDSERASVNRWKYERRKTSGWDLLQVQQFWTHMGVTHAVALDGGDSTQLVYRGPRGWKSISSGRFALTFGYFRDKPMRLWIPIVPTRHSHMGVLNYIYVKQSR